MTIQINKKIYLILIAVFVLCSFSSCSKSQSDELVLQYATINSVNKYSDSILRFEVGVIEQGENVDSYRGVRTMEYLSSDSVKSVEVAEGYRVRVCLYNLLNGQYMLIAEKIFKESFLLQDVITPGTEYVRFTVEAIQTDKNVDENKVNSELLAESKLSITDMDGNVYINCMPGVILESSGKLAVMKSHSLYTPQYIKLEKGIAIAIHNNYKMDWYAYSYSSESDSYVFCGNSSEHITNGHFDMNDVLDKYPHATHIRLEIIWADGASTITHDAVEMSQIAVFRDKSDYNNYKTGSIYSESGSENSDRNDRFYTPDYFSLNEFSAVTINHGYKVIWFAYSEDNGEIIYEKTDYWIGEGNFFTTKEIKKQCPNARYFRFAVCATNGFTVKTKAELSAAIKNSGVSIYTNQDNLKFYMGNIISDMESNDKYLPGKVISSAKKITTSLSNTSYIDAEKIKTLSLNDNASVKMYLYDENYDYLGNTDEYAASAKLKLDDFKEKYPKMRYARFTVKNPSKDLDFSNINTSCELLSISKDQSSYSIFRYNLNANETTGKIGFIKLGNIEVRQDGTVYDEYFVHMGSSNRGIIYNVNTFERIADVVLDGTVSIHSNSVCFGSDKYSENDDFPLLYCNVYNNYASQKDRKEGTCGVFRLIKDEQGNYFGELVQLINIAFVKDLNLWESMKDGTDFRPYGNFIIDTDNNKLYVYVMRDKEHIIRFFEFNCPNLTTTNSYDTIALKKKDILSTFDLNYYAALQGVTYHNGMIYSLDGFTNASIHLVDLKQKNLYATIDLAAMGLAYEPEAIFLNGEDILFSNSTGNVYKIMFD